MSQTPHLTITPTAVPTEYQTANGDYVAVDIVPMFCEYPEPCLACGDDLQAGEQGYCAYCQEASDDEAARDAEIDRQIDEIACGDREPPITWRR